MTSSTVLFQRLWCSVCGGRQLHEVHVEEQEHAAPHLRTRCRECDTVTQREPGAALPHQRGGPGPAGER